MSHLACRLARKQRIGKHHWPEILLNCYTDLAQMRGLHPLRCRPVPGERIDTVQSFPWSLVADAVANESTHSGKGVVSYRYNLNYRIYRHDGAPRSGMLGEFVNTGAAGQCPRESGSLRIEHNYAAGTVVKACPT